MAHFSSWVSNKSKMEKKFLQKKSWWYVHQFFCGKNFFSWDLFETWLESCAMLKIITKVILSLIRPTLRKLSRLRFFRERFFARWEKRRDIFCRVVQIRPLYSSKLYIARILDSHWTFLDQKQRHQMSHMAVRAWIPDHYLLRKGNFLPDERKDVISFAG